MKTIVIDQKTVMPTKVVCIGRNYVDHIAELNNETPDSMVLFNKPNSAITDTLWCFDATTRFEAEICFMVKNQQLAAVGVGLDLTHGEVQNEMKNKGLPWERAKAFDGSAVLSSFVTFDGDIKSLRMALYINGELRQHGDHSLMIYKPESMIDEIQTVMTLEDGDVIMTGTPKGVGHFHLGDVFEGKIYAGDELLVDCRWQVKAK